MLHHARSDFPKGFLFGAATSAYQIEGHQFGGAGRTKWDDFAATPGNVVRAEDGARACDHYHRFEADFDLLADAGFDAYRFSTSWARVMPDGRRVNPEGLDYYDRLTDALLERRLKPCATLYHWELPSALADQGGWRNRDIAGWFGDFTQTVMGRIGDRMHSVAPINEPWCVAWISHFLGLHAPGLRDIRATARAMHHVLLAHGTAIEAMRGLGMKNLGCVFNMEWAAPADDRPEAAEAALADFEDSDLALQYPAIAPSWRRAWNEVIPFLDYPPEVRRLIYTTNAIEALNSKIRRAVRTRGHFPSDEAAAKLIYLALNATSVEWKRSVREWHAVKSQFAIMFEDRFPMA
jgi:beta-glucosidase/6-phospho-beta-glucosidase/beta-galactosidase